MRIVSESSGTFLARPTTFSSGTRVMSVPVESHHGPEGVVARWPAPPRRRSGARAAGRRSWACRRVAGGPAPASGSPCRCGARWRAPPCWPMPPSRSTVPTPRRSSSSIAPSHGRAPSATTTMLKCRPAASRRRDLLAHLLDVERDLGNQDHVRAAGEPAVQGDPARVASHQLHHEHAVVALGGGVQLVERLGGGADRGVESEASAGFRSRRCRWSWARRPRAGPSARGRARSAGCRRRRSRPARRSRSPGMPRRGRPSGRARIPRPARRG